MIKKMVVKGCVLGVVIAGFFFYANYLYTGNLPAAPDINTDQASNTVASLGDSLKSRLSEMWGTITGSDKSDGNSASTGEIYRWKDETGAVHFGDNPPENALDLELMDNIDPDINLIQSSLPGPVEAPSQFSPGPNQKEQDIGGMGNVLDKAKKARDLMNERNRRQQQILDKT